MRNPTAPISFLCRCGPHTISRSVSTLWEASEGIYPYQSLLVQAAETGQPWWPGLSVYIWILPFLAPMAPKLFRSVATTISVLTTMVPFGVTAVTGCTTAAITTSASFTAAIVTTNPNMRYRPWPISATSGSARAMFWPFGILATRSNGFCSSFSHDKTRFHSQASTQQTRRWLYIIVYGAHFCRPLIKCFLTIDY